MNDLPGAANSQGARPCCNALARAYHLRPHQIADERWRAAAKIAKPTIEISDKVRLNLEKFV
jgi:hypothetical protein